MREKFFAGVVSILFPLLIAGCERTVTIKQIENVERIFWHEGDKYSVLVKNDDNTYKTVRFPNYQCGSIRDGDGVIIVADVPGDQKMWVSTVVQEEDNIRPYCFERLTIHIHSPHDIDGGGWDHGKFGRGQTSVIE